MARHNEIGKIGEDIGARWLVSRGMDIVSMNYRKKWGEIDIVARETSGMIHFVEVKTVSYETRDKFEYAVSHKTWRPEENVHHTKIAKLSRAIQSWLLEHKYTGEFQIDVLAVRMVPREKFARVQLIENIIIE